MPGALIKAMRPLQWTKNFFVFAALIFSGSFVDHTKLALSLIAFAAFCLLSSSIYLINDIADRERDRLHPRKKRRPIASGALPLPAAWAGFFIITCLGLLLAYFVNLQYLCIGAGYWLMMIAYTYVLKHQVIVDVFIIAAGFVLRALGGAIAIGVDISEWLVICTTLLSLFLALCKRRAELVSVPDGQKTREALKDYSLSFLDQMMSVVTAATVVSYTFYVIQSDTAAQHQGLIWTVPFVLYGIFRYLYLVYHKELGGSPEQLIIQDKPLLVDMMLWALVSAMMIWRR